MTWPTTSRARAAAVRALTPISGDESTVDALILYVHSQACVPQQHDPYCNTLRLLAEDQRHLARQAETLKARALPELGKLTPLHPLDQAPEPTLMPEAGTP